MQAALKDVRGEISVQTLLFKLGKLLIYKNLYVQTLLSLHIRVCSNNKVCTLLIKFVHKAIL